ncbi:MAG: DUF371 domain-containing protein [Methanobacteriaceae archaeon]
MNFKLKAKGHKNVSSKHKTTFEFTKDNEIGPKADCIIGVAMNKTMNDFPVTFKEKIANSDSEIIFKIASENGEDEIKGYGHSDLELSHPTDIVCRKSDYVCNRTLMIKADKASCDLNPNIIEDMKNSRIMEIEIIVK